MPPYGGPNQGMQNQYGQQGGMPPQFNQQMMPPYGQQGGMGGMPPYGQQQGGMPPYGQQQGGMPPYGQQQGGMPPYGQQQGGMPPYGGPPQGGGMMPPYGQQQGGMPPYGQQGGMPPYGGPQQQGGMPQFNPQMMGPGGMPPRGMPPGGPGGPPPFFKNRDGPMPNDFLMENYIDPNCEHKEVKPAKGWKHVTRCKDCGKGFYKDIGLISHHRSWFRLSKEFLNYYENLERENEFTVLKPQGRLISSENYMRLAKEVGMVGKRLRLLPASQFLGFFLAKQYLNAKNPIFSEIPDNEVAAVGQSALYLATKMREIDIHFPMIPKVLGAGDLRVSEEEIKKTEIEIAQFYEWNICMFTFYDFLEQFLHMGALFETDLVSRQKKVEIPKTKEEMYESLKQLKPELQAKALQYAKELEKQQEDKKKAEGGDPDDIEVFDDPKAPLNESFYEKLMDRLGLEKLVDEEPVIPAKDLEDDETETIVRKIEKRIFDLAKQVCLRYITDPVSQREIAYMIICASRKEAGVKDYDNQLLRSFYMIRPKDKEQFNQALELMLESCPNNSEKMRFDIVVRKYAPDGLEMLPPPLVMERQRDEGIVFQNMMKVPKYKAILTGQAPPPGQGGPPPGMPPTSDEMPNMGEVPMMANMGEYEVPMTAPEQLDGADPGSFRPKAEPTTNFYQDDDIFDPYDMGPNPNEDNDPISGTDVPGTKPTQTDLPGSSGETGEQGHGQVPTPGSGNRPDPGNSDSNANPDSSNVNKEEKKKEGKKLNSGSSEFKLPSFADDAPTGMAGNQGKSDSQPNFFNPMGNQNGPPMGGPPMGGPGGYMGMRGPPPGMGGMGGMGMPPGQRGQGFGGGGGYPPQGGYPPMMGGPPQMGGMGGGYGGNQQQMNPMMMGGGMGGPPPYMGGGMGMGGPPQQYGGMPYGCGESTPNANKNIKFPPQSYNTPHSKKKPPRNGPPIIYQPEGGAQAEDDEDLLAFKFPESENQQQKNESGDSPKNQGGVSQIK